ncbi:MAG: DUF3754 domain-containing protein [Planctomycetota bacterium]
MAVYDDRERFIPVSKAELVDLLKREQGVPDEDKEKFSAFCKMIEAIFHFEYHGTLEELKKTYAPFDPDRDTVAEYQLTPEEEKERMVRLVEGFGEACEGANYEKMSDEELNEAFEGWSPFGGINLKLDLNHYVEYALYYRGETERIDMIRGWLSWMMMKPKKPYSSKVYKRLAILAKVKDVGRQTKKFDTNHVFVKLFKNVPALDLEMLFPTTKPALKKFDMFQIYMPIMLGVLMTVFKTTMGFMGGVELENPGPVIAEVAENDHNELAEETIKAFHDGSLIVFSLDDNKKKTKVTDEAEALKALKFMRDQATGSEKAWADARLQYAVFVKGDFLKSFGYGVLAGGAAAFLVLFASWTMKSVFKYLQSKQKYQGVLAQNLFFLNLSNNANVFAALIDGAEEEECKEAFFASFFLNAYPKGHPETGKAWTEEALDDYIEHWIENNIQHTVRDKETGEEKKEGIKVDFEIDDALGKLERLELLVKHEDGTLSMKPWDEALERVDYIWDNYFQYNQG